MYQKVFLIRGFLENNIFSIYLTGEEDVAEVAWMTLYEGEPKRCGCGKWFKLVQVSPEYLKLHQSWTNV